MAKPPYTEWVLLYGWQNRGPVTGSARFLPLIQVVQGGERDQLRACPDGRGEHDEEFPVTSASRVTVQTSEADLSSPPGAHYRRKCRSPDLGRSKSEPPLGAPDHAGMGALGQPAASTEGEAVNNGGRSPHQYLSSATARD